MFTIAIKINSLQYTEKYAQNNLTKHKQPVQRIINFSALKQTYLFFQVHSVQRSRTIPPERPSHHFLCGKWKN